MLKHNTLILLRVCLKNQFTPGSGMPTLSKLEHQLGKKCVRFNLQVEFIMFQVAFLFKWHIVTEPKQILP